MKRYALALTLFALACTEPLPVPGPGTLTVTVQSPNGPEGAAVLVLNGRGLGQVSPVGDTEVYVEPGPSTARVVLINQVGGTLQFAVAIVDTTEAFSGQVLDVAGPDDERRIGLSGYSVEFGL